MPIDLSALWDFDQPEASEQRFRAALDSANEEDTLILQTQIARTYSLRSDFVRAQEILGAVAANMVGVGPEARVRHALELGRTHASAAHPPESQTDQAKESARSEFLTAFETAKAAQLDGLAIDALHMLAFVDTEPADQLRWGREALAVAQASSQPAAQKWEASLRNNIGYALHQLGRFDEALKEFRVAVDLREQQDNAGATRVAYWMVGWTLRSLDRSDEALAIQQRLERECDEAGEPDPYVFEELEHLYRDQGDTALATEYAARRAALTSSN